MINLAAGEIFEKHCKDGRETEVSCHWNKQDLNSVRLGQVTIVADTVMW